MKRKSELSLIGRYEEQVHTNAYYYEHDDDWGQFLFSHPSVFILHSLLPTKLSE